MSTMGGNSDSASDYVVLWNTGAVVAYLFGAILGMVNCLEHFSGLQESVTISPNASFGSEFALSIVALVMALVLCVLNLIHTRNYFRGEEKRSVVGLIASIGFLVLVGYELCRTVGGIATYYNADHSAAKDGMVTLIDIAFWGLLAFDVINACVGTLAFWLIFRKAELVNDLMVRQDGKLVEDETGIAAEAASHAMGRPEPSPEEREEEMRKHTPSQADHDPLEEAAEKAKKEAEEAAEKAKKEAEEAKKAEEEAKNKVPEERIEDKIGKLDMIEEAERKEREAKEEKERKAKVKKKKELPPILSVNPDNDMLGKINQDGRMLTIAAPTFAEGGDGGEKRKEQPITERKEIPRKVEESLIRMDEADIMLPVDKSDDDEEEPKKDDELMADDLPVDELPVDY